MPSSYSPLLRVELPATGEQSNTWGSTVNRNLGTLLEKSIAGAFVPDVTTGDVTLTAANGADDQARCAIMLVTGFPGVLRNIIAPATSKTYVVYNGSNASTIIKAPLTAGVALNVGEYAFVAWNGLDFIRIGVSPNSPTFNGVPTAPTAAVDNNSLQIANTAYVIAQGYIKAVTAALTYAPLNGVGTSGTWPITAANSNLLQGTAASGFFQVASLGLIGIANIDDARPTGIYTVDRGGFSSTILEYSNVGFGSSAARVQILFDYTDEMYFRVSRDTQTQWDGATGAVSNRVVHTGWFNPVNGVGASGTWPINISGTAAAASSVAWTSVTGRPTVVSAFTNDAGYINSSSLTPYAPLNNPTFTGIPLTTTAANTTNNTQIASTAYVQSTIAGGAGHSYTDVTGSRAAGTPFTNGNGRTIFVSTSIGISTSGSAALIVGGVQIAITQLNSGGGVFQLCGLVPQGSTYQVNISGTTTINLWTEI